MKKYVKPELIFESFEMTQQVAACEYDSYNSFENAACHYTKEDADFGSVTIFVDKDNCAVVAEAYCYHGSTGGFNIFNS